MTGHANTNDIVNVYILIVKVIYVQSQNYRYWRFHIFSIIWKLHINVVWKIIRPIIYCNTLQLLYTIDAEELCDLGNYINFPCYRPKKKQLPWFYILFDNYTWLFVINLFILPDFGCQELKTITSVFLCFIYMCYLLIIMNI